eukprot:3499131-Alexandrium_andersonii.AAC.1
MQAVLEENACELEIAGALARSAGASAAATSPGRRSSSSAVGQGSRVRGLGWIPRYGIWHRM